MNGSASLAALLAVGALALGGCASGKPEAPKAKWESYSFGQINKVTTESGWKSLREEPLAPQVLEVRVWSLGGLAPISGLSLRRDGLAWSGHRVIESWKLGGTPTVGGVSPKSGWEELWTTIDHLGILTLPDSSTLGKEELFYDEVTYVVEIKQGDKYRAYHYYMPQMQKWPEARQMEKILEAIYGEFPKP